MERKKPEIVAAFYTPILVWPRAASPELNLDVTKVITGLFEANKKRQTITRSGVGSWRTDDKFLEREEPAVVALRKLLISAISKNFADAEKRKIKGEVKELYGWANITEKYQYNTMHSHLSSHWSGVYYPSIGKTSKQERTTVNDETADKKGSAKDGESHTADAWPLSGMIEFQDPRGATHAHACPGFDTDQKLRIKPEEGMILVFPGWLMHMVHPFHGDGQRISVAFNANHQ